VYRKITFNYKSQCINVSKIVSSSNGFLRSKSKTRKKPNKK